MVQQIPETIIDAFEATRDKWQSCDWDTEFGSQKLKLAGLRSHQTERLARATSGAESQLWQEAANWLMTVESDALAAQTAAQKAVEAVTRDDLARRPTPDPTGLRPRIKVAPDTGLGTAETGHRRTGLCGKVNPSARHA